LIGKGKVTEEIGEFCDWSRRRTRRSRSRSQGVCSSVWYESTSAINDIGAGV